MSDLLEIFQVIISFVYYQIIGIIKNVTPMKLWQKKSLAEETVLITGGGGGIGRLLALQLAKRGCRLVLWDLNTAGNKETAAMLREQGAEVYTYTCDVSKAQNVYDVAKRVKEDVGMVTILVNNAGIVSGSNLLDIPDAKIIKTMEVNTLAHYWTLKSFLPDMIENNHGHIVTVASVLAEIGISGCSDYCASKSAAKATHQALMREIMVQNVDIKFTCVCPWKISTGLFEGAEFKYPRLVPTMTPEYVADKIAVAIETEQEYLYLPYTIQFVVFLSHLVPEKAMLILENFIGINVAMTGWVGHAGVKK